MSKAAPSHNLAPANDIAPANDSPLADGSPTCPILRSSTGDGPFGLKSLKNARPIKVGKPAGRPPTVPAIDLSDPTEQTALVQGPFATSATRAFLPTRAGRIQLLEEITHGGMGAVYRAYDPDLHRELAVKVLLPQHQHKPEFLFRFYEEAQITGQLQHPCIVPIHELGILPDGRPYFAMKLVEGQTLAALLRQRTAPSQDLARFLKIFEQICQTLAYAHARYVVHRDLKPANVMVGAFGEVQVMDWGLAKTLRTEPDATAPDAIPGNDRIPDPVCTWRSEDGGSATVAGDVLGTPNYMAPEQASGGGEGLDQRCDVFGLGAILCEILTGEAPYVGVTPDDVFQKAVRADLAEATERLSRSGADVELIALARACLDPLPSARIGDAGMVARRMTDYLANVQQRLRTSELDRSVAEGRAVSERHARRITVYLAVAVVCCIGAGVAGWVWNYRVEQDLRAERAGTLLENAQAFEAALNQAVFHQTEAKEHADDGPLWASAVARAHAAADNAEQLARAADPQLGWQERVGEVKASIRRDEAERQTSVAAREQDRRMVADLEEARLRGTEMKDGDFNFRLKGEMYEKVFRDYGVEVLVLPAERVAERLQSRPIKDQLVAALDDWGSLYALDRPERKQLALIARLTDPDAWRNRLRDALLVGDTKELMTLANEDQVADLPPSSVILLASALEWTPARYRCITLLRAAHQKHLTDFWLNHKLGMLLQQGKPSQHDESLRCLATAAALRPDSPGVHMNLGNTLHYKGQYESAAACFRRAIQLQPDYAEGYVNLGVALRMQKKYDESRQAIQTGLGFKPHANGYVALCMTLRDLGKLPEAIEASRKAIELSPNHVDAYMTIGEIELRRGNVDEGIKQLTQAVANLEKVTEVARPMVARLYVNLGSAWARKRRLEKAIEYYRLAIQADAAMAEAYSCLGDALEQLKKYPDAEASYRQALKINPNLDVAHAGLALTLAEVGRLEEAMKEIWQATELGPTEARYPTLLARIQYQRGQAALAAVACRKALDLDPDAADPHLILATIANDQYRWEDSVAEYQLALCRKPFDPAKEHYHLGNVLFQLGRFEPAVAAYLQALELRPDYAEAYCSLGDTYQNRGRFAEALAFYRKGHELGSKQHNWKYPSDKWIQNTERFIAIEGQLPKIQADEVKPANELEALEWAHVCYLKGHNVTTTRLYVSLFNEMPPLVANSQATLRFRAAAAAARAVSGEGEEALALPEPERDRLRGQALSWLRDYLALLSKGFNPADPGSRLAVRLALESWQREPAFDRLRESKELAKLSEDERAQIEKLWKDMADLLAQARAGK